MENKLLKSRFFCDEILLSNAYITNVTIESSSLKQFILRNSHGSLGKTHLFFKKYNTSKMYDF